MFEQGANLGHQAITSKDGNEIPLRVIAPAQPRELRRLASSVSAQMVRIQFGYSDAPPLIATSAPVM